MSELSLSACPICLAEDSFCLETIEREGRLFVWYECQECESVLLWMGDDEWSYQKVGREEKAHLLKQPLTVAELTMLLASPEEASASPEIAVLASDAEPLGPPESTSPEPDSLPTTIAVAVPGPEPFESPEAMAPVEDSVPTQVAIEAPDEESFESPAPTPPETRQRRGPGRLFAIGVIVTIIVLVLAIVGMLGSALGWFANFPLP